jgi:hypothetical protein
MATTTPTSENSETNPVNLDVDNLPVDSELVADENIIDGLPSSLTDEELDKEIKNLKVDQLNSLEIYKIIVDTRKFEIDNFWKRTLFFWGTLAIVIAGYFNAKNSEHYLLFVSYIGFFYNLIFSLSLRGSKYWQEHWEHTASSYEHKLKFRLFRWNLSEKMNKGNEDVFFLFRPYRFSVSKLSMILSDTTIMLWVILIIKDIKYLRQNKALHFDFSLHSSIDWYTLATVLIPTIFIFYICMFFWKGGRR